MGRLDEEHVVLFKSMYDVERDLNNQEKLDELNDLLRDHLYYEESQFCDALDVPWDYCKAHKGKLKHHVPEPYVWDTSFAVDYHRLDSEHNVLFANILDVSQHPEDAAKLQLL